MHFSFNCIIISSISIRLLSSINSNICLRLLTLMLAYDLCHSTTTDEPSTTPATERECNSHNPIITYSREREKSGQLLSLGHPNPYPSNVNCLYYLVGLPDERVEITFDKFELNGVPPRCLHDYIDIYTQVRYLSQNLLTTPLHGRFCGKGEEDLPHKIISMTNILVIGLYTDATGSDEGFKINYTFISDAIYRVGAPATNHVCGLIVTKQKNGTILSPTYPGMYPDNITCFYKLQGEKGERIRLTFNDVDLYYGGRHCPFDHIKIYDGATNEAHVIDTFCGPLTTPYIIYSTKESMEVYFVTKTGRKAQLGQDDGDGIKSLRKGFNATFEIGKQFVNLELIKEGDHIEGTECDRKIRSKSQSNGTVTSPYYPDPFPQNITCHYYIDGLVDKQNLENVELFIDDLDLGVQSYSTLEGVKCDRGYLQAFSQKNTLIEWAEKKDRTIKSIADYEKCGKLNINSTSNFISSDNPRLLLIFDSHGSPPGRGFKASYQFKTDYAIPGTAVNLEAKCHFVYNRNASISGSFNSPRHPSFYPDNTYCIYEFQGGSDEVVRIVFENFKVEDDANCSKDYVDVFKVVTTVLPESKEVIKVGHYCGERLPGPQEEDSNIIRVTLHSDNNKVVKNGFRAKYEFVKPQHCFHNVTGGGGKIESPNYPHKYTTNIACEWIIWGRPKSHILLLFDIFGIEGNPTEKIGCGNAVLKIYTNRSGMPALELCGENRSIESMHIVSQSNMLRLKFISSNKATGGKGFLLPWTELLQMRDGKCSGFLCKKNNYCIASSLKCNGLPNCGRGDDSDETSECGTYRFQGDLVRLTYRETGALNIILGVVGGVIVLILIFVFFLHRRRRSRNEKKEIEVRYMTRSASLDQPGAGASLGDGTNSLLRERTEKVSIV